jgi:ABC-type branched-subunit amino acid transport system permease subunit
MVIYGGVLIAIVMFLPRGIAGLRLPSARPRPAGKVRTSG